MSDLIERQAAIEAIDALHDKPNAWLDSAVDAVMNLPSAQPEHEQNTPPEQGKSDKFGVKMGETCTDTISRKAAIDAFDTHADEIIIGGEENARNVLNYLNKVIDTIKGLPSAQPEVLKCKDCYWWTKQSDSLQGRCDRYGFYPTGYWYCAAARGRREE